MKVSEHQPLSSSAENDLWEHACLLFHNFEWQSAADTFLDLERSSSDHAAQSNFALNRGLVEARLGDFDLAAASFSRALLLVENDPIAHFLLGILDTELRDYTKASVHFECSLERLSGEILDCRARGLAFTLARSSVQENADRVRSIPTTAAGRLGENKAARLCLHSIPADIIFEAPSRSKDTSQAREITTIQYTSSRVSENHTKPTLDPVIETTPRELHSLPTTSTGDSTPTPLASSLSTREIGHDNEQLKSEPRAQTRLLKKLSPRDAHVRDDSTRELAQFLRHAGPSGDANITVNRRYLQGLMQSHNSALAAQHFDRQSSDALDKTSLGAPSVPQRDDVESLLDLYTGTSAERGSAAGIGYQTSELESPSFRLPLDDPRAANVDLSKDDPTPGGIHVPRKALPKVDVDAYSATGK